MAATRDEYHIELQKNLARMNTSRDEAVRMTNEHFGYGSSTALQHDVPDTPAPSPQPHKTKPHKPQPRKNKK
jgi:hypothetical protein